ncbi:MAG: response regulator [Blastopirellula sp.]|nr:MAG: response regulator [Blastopirellula sp.]
MPHILVVDDSRLSRRMVVDKLKEAGHETVEAINGKEGLDLLRLTRPDCVVTDLLMPVMGGQELLRNIRSINSEIPVIIASADIQISSRSECEELGISGFLQKPVDAQSLLTCVNEALNQEIEVVNNVSK